MEKQRQFITIDEIPVGFSNKKKIDTANANEDAHSNTAVQENLNDAVSLKQEAKEAKVERQETKKKEEERDTKQAQEMSQVAAGQKNTLAFLNEALGIDGRDAKKIVATMNYGDLRAQGDLKKKAKGNKLKQVEAILDKNKNFDKAMDKIEEKDEKRIEKETRSKDKKEKKPATRKKIKVKKISREDLIESLRNGKSHKKLVEEQTKQAQKMQKAAKKERKPAEKKKQPSREEVLRRAKEQKQR